MNISVVVASFGADSWRELASARAIPSTVGQGFNEVIVVHLEQATLAQARNAGAARAVGDWLLFLDADDELAPGFGDAMREALWDNADASAPLLYTPAVQYVRNATRPAPKIWPRMDFKVGNWCVIGTLISRKIFTAIGGFCEYGMYEDYALWAMAEAQFGVGVVEVPEAIYVAHYARLSRNRARPNQRLYWHQRVGRDVWPDHFDELSPEEDLSCQLATSHLRFV